ncbi:unnamed protein product [Protopolystoma xenopodis]|uniref:Uncharacterized protein n=1 Tax=Protopolystoma xenopodis TaxID=117903 RepID=A0A448WT28_9PLAT|nr:unnamed protein product [Protopolystoma xenopodis]
MVLRMARLTDDAGYDAGETSGNVPRPRSNSGNDDAYNGLRTSCSHPGPSGLQFRPRNHACQAPNLHCHGSTPAEGVDQTDARSKLQSTGA